MPSGSFNASVEGVAAGAGTARVRVVDGKALLLERVDVVDRGACQVRSAHPVDDDIEAVNNGRGFCEAGGFSSTLLTGITLASAVMAWIGVGIGR